MKQIVFGILFFVVSCSTLQAGRSRLEAVFPEAFQADFILRFEDLSKEILETQGTISALTMPAPSKTRGPSRGIK